VLLWVSRVGTVGQPSRDVRRSSSGGYLGTNDASVARSGTEDCSA